MKQPNDLVCVNGNDGQLPQIQLFYESLRSPERGAFYGDCCVLTTGLSEENRVRLGQEGMTVFVDDLLWLFSLPVARKIGLFEAVREECRKLVESVRGRVAIGGADISIERLSSAITIALFEAAKRTGSEDKVWLKRGRQLFSVYRNKHFSKLGLVEFLSQVSKRYDRILVCDADLVFQRPVTDLLNLVGPSRIMLGEEFAAITPGTEIYRSNRLAERYHSLLGIMNAGPNAHEPNVGVLAGTRDSILRLFRDWMELMFRSEYQELFVAHPRGCWHEQDFLRLYRDLNPSRFQALPKSEVVHLCNGGVNLVSESRGWFRLRENGVYPTIVHFAGGSWSRYSSVRSRYLAGCSLCSEQ